MNALFDLVRHELSSLQSSLKGHSDISDQMEALLQAIMSNLVPSSWCAVGHDSAKGLAKWFIVLLNRVTMLDSWKDRVKEGFAAPLSVWMPGLLNPYSLMNACKQTYLRANPAVTAWHKLDITGSVTVWNTEQDLANFAETDPHNLPREGLLVHGFVLEGAAWDSSSDMLVDQVLQDLHPSVPVLHVKTVHTDEEPAAVPFPHQLNPDDDQPFHYDCPVRCLGVCVCVRGRARVRVCLYCVCHDIVCVYCVYFVTYLCVCVRARAHVHHVSIDSRITPPSSTGVCSSKPRRLVPVQHTSQES